MNKYNVKALRDELDNYVANRSWNNFRKKFSTLLPLNFMEELSVDGVSSHAAAVDKDYIATNTIVSNKKQLELCRAVVELKKQRSRMAGFTETCPSLLHDLCHKFQPKSSSSSWHHHNRPPPVPMDILEMVTLVCSRKIYVAQYGKRKQTPLALLLDQHPPAYVVERLLSIMTRRHGDDPNESESLKVLYIQDACCDTPLSQTIKRLPGADDIVRWLVERDNLSLGSLLVESRSGNTPLYFLLHRELKELQDDHLGNSNSIYQELPTNLLYLLLKTQRAVLLKQGFSFSDHIALDCMKAANSADGDKEEGLFRVPSSDSDNSESRSADSVRALQATICCSHRLLSNEKDLTKLIGILLQNLRVVNNLDAVDEESNTFLHWICMAGETDCHLENGAVSFLLSQHPAAVLARNKDGKLPLHLAIENKQNWKLIQRLLFESPHSARIRMSTASCASTQHRGQLPLHMVLSQNMHVAKYRTEEIVELWNAFPGASLIPDPMTGLLPFQLAAVSAVPPSPTKRMNTSAKNKKSAKRRSGDCTAKKNERRTADMQTLSTIYAVLRRSPDSLKVFL